MSLHGLSQEKVTFIPKVCVAGVTPEIDLLGGTLCGLLLLADITSTTFTITVSNESGGTFVTVKDPLGTYVSAGSTITFTVGSTATGYFPIPPFVTAGFRYCKITLDSSETPTIYPALRSME